ncbi:uncharacterized protein [Maniola hyperantus]|uniref:uncharacterized protein n=1 Tax=Aphantopus hyperantus TaxID=2795564 RepID=UPI0037490AB4
MSSNSTNKCSACGNKAARKTALTCADCSDYFHFLCLGIDEEQSASLANQYKATWRCPNCITRQKRGGDNSNTPVRSPQISTAAKTLDDICTVSSPAICSREEQNIMLGENSMATMINDIKKSVIEAVQSTLQNMLDSKFSELTKQISELSTSVSFFSTKYDEITKRLEMRDKEVTELSARNRSLEATVKDLTHRVSTMEQYSRECNVEINGLPEFKSENLAQTVTQIGKAVSVTVEDSEVMSCFRVAKRDGKNDRPRTVIVKLRSTRCRDTLLAAYYKYNRMNRSDRLSTQAVGIGGDKTPIYLSEHLSPSNKLLLAETKKKAKEAMYTFVWVRNGKIYVRKDENSSAKIINNSDDVQYKLK